MNRIVIEVDEKVAMAFMQAGRQRQQSISSAINGWLKKAVDSDSLNDYKQMLDSMSDEAEKNGLTQEKLERLLKEHD